MLLTLIVLSTASIKNETPSTKLPKLQCLNPVRGSPKLEASNDIGTDKCIAIPDRTKQEVPILPSRKVVK